MLPEEVLDAAVLFVCVGARVASGPLAGEVGWFSGGLGVGGEAEALLKEGDDVVFGVGERALWKVVDLVHEVHGVGDRRRRRRRIKGKEEFLGFQRGERIR